ncbi:MAG: DUF4214 domain-containing protein [Roseococcus sp.]
MITISELLYGADEDFLVNLYLAILGRWPDDAGFAHHRKIIEGRAERRLEVVEAFLESEEGRQRRSSVIRDLSAVTAEQALAAQLRLRTEYLRTAIEGAREPAAAPGPGSSVLGEIAALGAAIAALGVELRERIAAVEALAAGQVSAAPNLSPAVSVDYVNDLIQAAQAQTNQRLRMIEKRLAEQQ